MRFFGSEFAYRIDQSSLRSRYTKLVESKSLAPDEKQMVITSPLFDYL